MTTANLSQVQGIYTAWDFLNTVSPMFGISILVMTFFVVLFVMKQNFEMKRALPGAMFLTTIISVWMRAIELIPTYAVIVCVVGLILSMFWLKLGQAEQFG